MQNTQSPTNTNNKDNNTTIVQKTQNNEIFQSSQSHQKNQPHNKVQSHCPQLPPDLQPQPCTTAFRATYTRSPYARTTHHPVPQLILVYLMYKQQKLSLFLNKNTSFQQLLKKLYKEIYIFQKETYSISNVILKNLLNKITGFQSIDNDLVYDYQLKYRRGKLDKQKFFVPFGKDNNIRVPFKIYCKIEANRKKQQLGEEFLVRNYSDGEWGILTAIKKSEVDQEKLNFIKKSLKLNFNACSLLIKNTCSSISQINWFETKNHIFVVSEYYPQSLKQNLEKNKNKKLLIFQILQYLIKQLVTLFKSLISCNIQIFKKISLENFILSPANGSLKLNLINNIPNCYDSFEKKKNILPTTRRISQKITDCFYQETLSNLIKDLKNCILTSQDTIIDEDQDFPSKDLLNKVFEITEKQQFTFQQILTIPQLCVLNETGFKNKRYQVPFKVDFTSKLSKIASNMHDLRSTCPTPSAITITQIKQQIHRFFTIQIHKNRHNQPKNLINSLINPSFHDINKQNIGNISQFKKQQERKEHLKTKQKIFVHEIINELNQNQNFILTTKQNNLKSIEFYLKKSNENIKKKMIGKIQTKYKKFFEKSQGDERKEERKGSGIKEMCNNTFNTSNSESMFGGTLGVDSVIGQKDETGYERQKKLSTQHKKAKYQYFLPIKKKNLFESGRKSNTFKKVNTFIVPSNCEQKQNAPQRLSELPIQLSPQLKTSNFSLKSKIRTSNLYPSINKKPILQQLFVNSRDYSNNQRLTLKKKQYGIYLQEAQKQYNRIGVLKKTFISTKGKNGEKIDGKRFLNQ